MPQTTSSMIKYILAGIVLLAAAFYLGNAAGKTDLAKYIREYTEFRKQAAITTIYADSLKVEAAKWMASANAKDTSIAKLKNTATVIAASNRVLITRIDSLKADADTMTNIVALIENKTKTITLLTKVVTNDSIIIVKKDSIISYKDLQISQIKASAEMYKKRGDSLQVIVINIPKPPPNPGKLFGFIPLPSRSVVGVVAFIGGVYVGHQALK